MQGMNIKIVQGDDADLVFTVLDKDEAAVDCSGASAITFVIRREIEGDDLVSKSLGSGIAVGSPTNEITVTLTDTDTEEDSLTAGEYYFELKITDSAGNISTVRDFYDKLGKLEILADLKD